MKHLKNMLFLAAGPLALPACSDRLLRENVLANTETMVGVQVSQDPRTAFYQLRAGYARHELFLVPTGKRIVHEDEAPAAGSNDADRTPEVLGEIMVDGALGPTQTGTGAAPGAGPGVGVYQRLAVGPRAVSQPAAIALFARDADAAASAAAALTHRYAPDAATAALRAWLAGGTDRRAALERWLATQPGGPVRVPELLNAEEHAALRERAARELVR